jgi:hypothetical protein
MPTSIMFAWSPRPIHLVAGFGLLALVARTLAGAGNSVLPAPDETNYLIDGLLLLEGLAPGYKHVPNAVLNWLVGTYAAIQTAFQLLTNPEVAATPGLLKPLVAMEQALFVDHADLTTLRHIVVALQILMGTIAAGAIAWRGHVIAGVPGALVAGALAAGTPLFIEFATHSRAYSFAWSLALLAFVALDAIPRRSAAHIAAGAIAGLAVATRVEMGMVFVPMLLEILYRAPEGEKRRALLFTVAMAVLVFLAAAPWYLTSIAGNLRQIISVRLMSPPVEADAGASAALIVVLQGIGIPIALTVWGLIATRGRGRFYLMTVGIWMALLAWLAVKPSVHGLRHDAPLLLLVALMSPWAIRQLLERGLLRGSAMTQAIAALVALHLAVAGLYQGWRSYSSAIDGDPVAWIEKNVPAGSTVYWFDGFKVPLPTEAASDRLWADVASADSWRVKFRNAVRKFDLADRLPRAMSEDPMQLERAIRRRWFILGAPVDKTRPRYDIWLIGYNSPFFVTPPDAIERVCREGGAYFHVYEQAGTHRDQKSIDRMGKPAIVFSPNNGEGKSIMIYAMPPPQPGEGRRC